MALRFIGSRDGVARRLLAILVIASQASMCAAHLKTSLNSPPLIQARAAHVTSEPIVAYLDALRELGLHVSAHAYPPGTESQLEADLARLRRALEVALNDAGLQTLPARTVREAAPGPTSRYPIDTGKTTLREHPLSITLLPDPATLHAFLLHHARNPPPNTYFYDEPSWARDRTMRAATAIHFDPVPVERLDPADLATPIGFTIRALHESGTFSSRPEWLAYDRIQGKSLAEINMIRFAKGHPLAQTTLKNPTYIEVRAVTDALYLTLTLDEESARNSHTLTNWSVTYPILDANGLLRPASAETLLGEDQDADSHAIPPEHPDQEPKSSLQPGPFRLDVTLELDPAVNAAADSPSTPPHPHTLPHTTSDLVFPVAAPDRSQAWKRHECIAITSPMLDASALWLVLEQPGSLPLRPKWLITNRIERASDDALSLICLGANASDETISSLLHTLSSFPER